MMPYIAIVTYVIVTYYCTSCNLSQVPLYLSVDKYVVLWYYKCIAWFPGRSVLGLEKATRIPGYLTYPGLSPVLLVNPSPNSIKESQ